MLPSTVDCTAKARAHTLQLSQRRRFQRRELACLQLLALLFQMYLYSRTHTELSAIAISISAEIERTRVNSLPLNCLALHARDRSDPSRDGRRKRTSHRMFRWLLRLQPLLVGRDPVAPVLPRHTPRRASLPRAPRLLALGCERSRSGLVWFGGV